MSEQATEVVEQKQLTTEQYYQMALKNYKLQVVF